MLDAPAQCPPVRNDTVTARHWLLYFTHESQESILSHSKSFEVIQSHSKSFKVIRSHWKSFKISYRIFSIYRPPPPINAPPLFAPQSNDLRKDEVAKKPLKIEKLHLFQCLLSGFE